MGLSIFWDWRNYDNTIFQGTKANYIIAQVSFIDGTDDFEDEEDDEETPEEDEEEKDEGMAYN